MTKVKCPKCGSPGVLDESCFLLEAMSITCGKCYQASNILEWKNGIIFFYRSNGEYGFLSNLYKSELEFEGITFPTAEHAYQYGKFRDEKTREWAMKAPKPHLLAILAHGLFSWDIVKNWSKIKVERMYEILKVKFSDLELKRKLLDTGDAILKENSKTDSFWGIGRNAKGKNMLGKLLMEVREEIKKESGNKK